MNVEAAILARITKRAKIVLLGNVLPIWDDPLWLAEELAKIDMISRGRLVSGWVRGTGRESVAHNAQSPYNWERFQEAHDFIVKAWTTPGPVPLGGRALPLPLREPLGAAVPDSRTRRSGSPACCRAQHGRVARRAPLPVRHARDRARAHQEVVRLLRRGRDARTATRPARSTAATCSRSTSTRPRSWPTRPRRASTSRARRNPFLEGNQGDGPNPFIQNLPGMTSRTDAAADRRGLRRCCCRAARTDRQDSTAPAIGRRTRRRRDAGAAAERDTSTRSRSTR